MPSQVLWALLQASISVWTCVVTTPVCCAVLGDPRGESSQEPTMAMVDGVTSLSIKVWHAERRYVFKTCNFKGDPFDPIQFARQLWSPVLVNLLVNDRVNPKLDCSPAYATPFHSVVSLNPTTICDGATQSHIIIIIVVAAVTRQALVKSNNFRYSC